MVNTIGFISIGSLALLTLALIAPELAMDGNTHALVIDCSGRECDALTTIKTDVNVGTVISLGLDSYIGVDIVPKSEGAFASESTRLTVSTNSPEGYSLYMQTIDGTSKLSNITNPELTNAVINPLVAEVSSDTMAANPSNYANQWGYALDATSTSNVTYKPVPTNQSMPIKVTSGMSGNSIATTNPTADDVMTTSEADTSTNLDSYSLSFGVSVDTSLPAGTYSNKVLVSAVANPVTITNLNQLVYMQDMTPSICANTAFDTDGHMTKETADLHNPVTKRLVDTRDGNKYWVSKLADGNCWMTQNLALNIDQTVGLNSNTSDLGWTASDADGSAVAPTETKYWQAKSSEDNKTINNGQSVPISSDFANINRAYAPTTTYTTIPQAVSSPSYMTTYSWNLGKWVVALPKMMVSVETISDIDEYASKAGLVDVSGEEWQPTFVAKEGTFILPEDTLDEIKNLDEKYGKITLVDGEYRYSGYVAVDMENKTYDAHYLLGNYYQYGAATAGSGVNLANSEAADSVCPRNWKLPISRHGTEDVDDSYAHLLNLYDMINSNKIEGPVSTDEYGIQISPLYFIPSGWTDIKTGTYRWANRNGLFTSSSAGNAGMMYRLNVAHRGNYWSIYGTYGDYEAFSVRCIAR